MSSAAAPPQTTTTATTPPQKQAWSFWSCCSWLAKILSVLFASIVPIYIAYIMALNFWTLDAYVVSQFQRPSAAELVLYEKGDFIDRPQLEKNLEYLLSNATNHYALIWGENGVGKTSAVIKVINEKLRPKGVPIFYIAAQKDKFQDSLTSALGFHSTSQITHLITGVLKMERPELSMKFVFESLDRVARKMKQESGYRPVLVIDACNNLEHTPEGSKFLEAVQDWAKVAADANGMNVIFVTSDGRAPVTLRSRSASSRMSSLRVYEATDDEAREYLKLKKSVHDIEEQNHVISITGGVFKYLLLYPNLADVNSQIISHLNQHNFTMKNLGFVSVSRSILEHGNISRSEFLDTFEDEVKAVEALKTNAFLYDPADDRVSFQNRATRTVISKIFETADAKKKEEEAVQLAKKKEEEAIQLAKKKEEEAIQLAKRKEQFMKLIEEEEKALQNSSLITICRTILDKGSIPIENFVDMVGGFNEADRMLKGLMFVLNPEDQKVTFQSVVTRRRLAEKLALIEEEKDSQA